jgi:arabinose-5-phosphate isomerase
MDYWQTGLAALRIEEAGLSKLIESFESDLADGFNKTVAMVLDTKGRTIVSGMGKSGHIGRKFAATLSSTGTPAQFIHAGEASHGDLGGITSSDIVFLISNSGESEELSAIIEHTRRFAIPSIAITARANSTLGRNVNVVLKMPQVEEACPNGLAPTTSTTLQLALCDALAVTLLSARKFKPVDFRIYHPGGKLGASIRTVASVMHTGAALPIVQPHTIMRDAILEMTTKELGILGVVDSESNLLGAITDGDLRRHIADANLFENTAANVMTRNPRVIGADELISVAVREMEVNKITALFVLNEQSKLSGLIRLGDLARIGVI